MVCKHWEQKRVQSVFRLNTVTPVTMSHSFAFYTAAKMIGSNDFVARDVRATYIGQN